MPIATLQHWELQLQELAMYLLLWTEAANLRHLPECLWFLLNLNLNAQQA